jgi:hypothetical protein
MKSQDTKIWICILAIIAGAWLVATNQKYTDETDGEISPMGKREAKMRWIGSGTIIAGVILLIYHSRK